MYPCLLSSAALGHGGGLLDGGEDPAEELLGGGLVHVEGDLERHQRVTGRPLRQLLCINTNN